MSYDENHSRVEVEIGPAKNVMLTWTKNAIVRLISACINHAHDGYVHQTHACCVQIHMHK